MNYNMWLEWFQQYGFNLKGNLNQVDILARAKGTSVDDMKQTEIIEASKGKVCLKKYTSLPRTSVTAINFSLNR